MKVIRPFVVTSAALLSSNVAETDYAAWNNGTTYAAEQRCIKTSTHHIYESIAGSNLNHDPETDDGTYWLDVGPTNRWRMFDASNQSQTTNPDTVAVSVQAVGRIDSVALMNLNAASARVKMTDAVDGVVYDETVSLVSNSGIEDIYAYTFEPIVRIGDKAFNDLPPYSNAVLNVTITDTGGIPAIGGCVPGQSKEIGETVMGASVGIRDYSVKDQDAFGNFTITERAFSKRANFTILVAAAFVDQLQALLASYRATPIVYQGDEDYGATLIYGFFKDFNIEISYPEYSMCSLEVEGLA